MSVEAITWALRQPISHSSAKFVLVVLANCASAEGQQAWPSIAYLAQSTGQDRKTIVQNLGRLIEWSLIEDTGKRVGTTKQIIVYRLRCSPDLFQADEEKRNGSENGTVPKKAGNSPVFPSKQSQKRDTEPSLTQRNRQSSAQRSALRFTEFWDAYPQPHRVGRKPALEKWKAKNLDALADRILADISNRIVNDRRWLDGFVPNPTTYLTQERWIDDVAPRRDAPAAAAPKRIGAAAALAPTESPLEREIGLARHDLHFGRIDEAECQKRITAATQRHRETQQVQEPA